MAMRLLKSFSRLGRTWLWAKGRKSIRLEAFLGIGIVLCGELAEAFVRPPGSLF
jgi:hypothetical protein